MQKLRPSEGSLDPLKLISVSKTSLDGGLGEEYKNNENSFTISNEGTTITITQTAPFQSYDNGAGLNEKWYGLLIDLGILREDVIAVDGYSFDSGETEDTYAQQWGATNDNQFILWLSEENGNVDITFGDRNSLHEDTTINITFEKYIPTQVEVTNEENLIEGIGNVKDGGTVKLTSNINLTKPLVVDKSITLDLGTNNIEAGEQTVLINKDTVITGTGEINSNSSTNAVQVENAKLTLNGGKINSTKLYGVNLVGISEIVIEDGEIHSKDSSISCNNGDAENVTITINNGTISSDTDATIYVPSPCTINVNGGTLNGGINARMGTININGGTINSIASGNDKIEEYYNFQGNVWLGDAIACMAGTYTTPFEKQSNKLAINISKGTINGLCNGCSAVAIYNLGKVAQDISVTIGEDAILTVTDDTQPLYKKLSAKEIVPSGAKDYKEYTAIENTVTENIPEKFLT